MSENDSKKLEKRETTWSVGKNGKIKRKRNKIWTCAEKPTR